MGERYAVYGLLVLFIAYTGLRAAEVPGLEVRDLVLTVEPTGTTRGSVRVQRTKTRRRREWVTGRPKSKTSKRTVPLPDWLAGRMADYLATVHPHANNPTAVLWPRRLLGNRALKPPLDWAAPLDLNGLQRKIIRPALEAVGLQLAAPPCPQHLPPRPSSPRKVFACMTCGIRRRPLANGGRPLYAGSEVAGA